MVNKPRVPQEYKNDKDDLARDVQFLRGYGSAWCQLAEILLDREKKI